MTVKFILSLLLLFFVSVSISVSCYAADTQLKANGAAGDIPLAVQRKADIEYLLGYENEINGKWEDHIMTSLVNSKWRGMGK